MTRLWLVIALAGCPRGGDHKEPSPPPRKGDAQALLLAIDDAGVELAAAPALPAVPRGLPAVALPASVTPDAVALGELLFFDPRLSSTGALACASCHDPEHGWSGRIDKTAEGAPDLRRTPALVNLGWQRALGWDGRYRSIDELLPVHVRGQLGNPLDAIARRLADLPIYRAHLARLGGAPEDAIARALAAFTLTRYDGDSPWDRIEPTAHAPRPGAAVDPVVAGYMLFTGKARCADCHPPPLYTDLAYHAVIEASAADKGRGLVDPTAVGAFKTPTLRGAGARPAFFHTGKVETLDATLHAGPKHAVQLAPADEQALLAFVRSLSGASAVHKPTLP